ncbi:MAG: hypothetical protein FWH50_02275 [Coriobacteriia bacterium]|nr:hypothetical protein [Coriobacteriia bacterium]
MAFVCVLFGVYNPLPLQGLIEPVLGESLEHTLSGLPHSWLLVAISAAVLLLALANHNYGVRRSGEPLGAVDHIHYAPVMKTVYGWAEAGLLDPYNICGRVMDVFSRILFLIDRAIDWVYSTLAPTLADWISLGINKAHVERPYMSVLWILGGAAFVALLFIWMGG